MSFVRNFKFVWLACVVAGYCMDILFFTQNHESGMHAMYLSLVLCFPVSWALLSLVAYGLRWFDPMAAGDWLMHLTVAVSYAITYGILFVWFIPWLARERR